MYCGVSSLWMFVYILLLFLFKIIDLASSLNVVSLLYTLLSNLTRDSKFDISIIYLDFITLLSRVASVFGMFSNNLPIRPLSFSSLLMLLVNFLRASRYVSPFSCPRRSRLRICCDSDLSSAFSSRILVMVSLCCLIILVMLGLLGRQAMQSEMSSKLFSIASMRFAVWVPTDDAEPIVLLQPTTASVRIVVSNSSDVAIIIFFNILVCIISPYFSFLLLRPNWSVILV